ncbi:MAG TPA: histidine kinase [Streptosporangiaceae bacterium]|nr:histidine kinase [Streptosporangiaceae bacterium]
MSEAGMPRIQAGIKAFSRSLSLSLAGAASAAPLVILVVVPGLLVKDAFVVSNPGIIRVAAGLVALLSLLCLVPLTLLAAGPLANVTRRLTGLPLRRLPSPRRLLSDRGSWRDLGWLALSLPLALFLLLPAIAAGVGLIAFIGSRVLPAIPPPAYPGNGTLSILLAGAALTAAGLWATPPFLRGYEQATRALLAPPDLQQRVHDLSQTRTELLDAGAAEVRRIERDLHDGAQARLVAMGMTLDAAGQLIHQNPEAAQALLTEAKENSVKALAELRALVRGILPPVLADRGLADAIRALALDTPLRTYLASDLDGSTSLNCRLPAPVESAAYFAVSELLANVCKHAEARQAWIDVRLADGMLKIAVTDDGHGGADPHNGTGLHGIERRLAAFDGLLAVTSPPGGPTSATIEIPIHQNDTGVTSGTQHE